MSVPALQRLARAAIGVALTMPALATAEALVSLAFVGDIMLGDTPGKLIKRGHDPFAAVAPLLAKADVRIGNLECVIATSGRAEPGKIFTLRAHPRVLKPLKRHFDVLSLANNHSGDYGPVAFTEMLEHLSREKIAVVGGGRTLAAAHAPQIVEREGLRIAFLAYNEFLPRSFEADVDKAGVAWSEDEQVQFDIVNARQRHHADLVIPIMHWGWENEATANERQRHLARLMIDAGADAVVGGHPHVTQDTETYRGKPILYSLGNFVFDSFTRADNNTGWVLRMDADRAGIVRWRTDVVHIDRQGLPHPAKPSSAGACWQRGMEHARSCDAPETR